jgi:hypothetical protein
VLGRGDMCGVEFSGAPDYRRRARGVVAAADGLVERLPRARLHKSDGVPLFPPGLFVRTHHEPLAGRGRPLGHEAATTHEATERLYESAQWVR